MSNKTMLERQTDRVVSATTKVDASIQKQTAATQEQTVATLAQTAAVMAQTSAIDAQTRATVEGFAATVAALQEQTDVLRSVEFGVQNVAREMRGMRDDIYAAAQNREALEAKGKLDRADQLLSSDLAGDAVRLIREAEVLNPADFAVWAAKVIVCQRMLDGHSDAMTVDEARRDGAAAVERSLKLYPAQLLGSARGLQVLRWLADTSILLECQATFLRAVAMFGQSIDAGGTDLTLYPPAAGMTRFLRAVQQGELAGAVARAQGRLLARAAASDDAETLRSIVPLWVDLSRTHPEAVAPEIERAIAAGAKRALGKFVDVCSALKFWGEPKRRPIRVYLRKLAAQGRAPLEEVMRWRETLSDPAVDEVVTQHAEVDFEWALCDIRSHLADVEKLWVPEVWWKDVGDYHQPVEELGCLGLLVLAVLGYAAGQVVAMFVLAAAIPVLGDEYVILVVLLWGGITAGSAIVTPIGFYGANYIRRSRPLPTPNTVEFMAQLQTHFARWRAAASVETQRAVGVQAQASLSRIQG
jgi:hypothetical protein